MSRQGVTVNLTHQEVEAIEEAVSMHEGCKTCGPLVAALRRIVSKVETARAGRQKR